MKIPELYDMGFTPDSSISTDGVRIHYVIGGPKPGTAPAVLLIHGFPQNWWSWHKIMPELAKQYTVIAPDMRGIGLSERPQNDYTKKKIASNLNDIIEKLGCGPAHVVGHDVGGMVAYSYGLQFKCATLTILDVPIPGVGDWDTVISDPKLWHFAFHQKRDLAEALICGGKEYMYVTSFIYDRSHIWGAYDEYDMQEYVRAYSHAGAFRAGMEMYRAFPQDAIDNKAAGRLPDDLRVLALGGETRWGPVMINRLSGVAKNLTGGSVKNCGHFIAEEQPKELLEKLKIFFS